MADPVLNESEQVVMDHLLAVMNGIQGWGLKSNTAEMAQAIHVLQGFVIQHMLNRVAPDEWGSWYEDAR